VRNCEEKFAARRLTGTVQKLPVDVKNPLAVTPDELSGQ